MDNSYLKNLSERMVYDPIGHCIYCRAHDKKLTDEHTIPDGMGGRHILPKASCESCQKTINLFEQYCMRTLFPNTRAAWGIKGSRKRQEPKRSIKVKKRDGTIQRIHRPISQLPILTALPVWPEPFALEGREPTETFAGFQWVHEPFDWEDVQREFDADAILTEEIKPYRFARFIAKIAHAHSVAILGEDRFEPWLTGLICDPKPQPWIHLVGGSIKVPPPEPQHTIQMWFAVIRRRTDKMNLGMFTIRLFPQIGGPVYHAIIGRMLKPWPVERGD